MTKNTCTQKVTVFIFLTIFASSFSPVVLSFQGAYTVHGTVDVKLLQHSSTSDTIVVFLQGQIASHAFEIKLSTCADNFVKLYKYELSFYTERESEFRLGVKLGGDKKITEKVSWLDGLIKLHAYEPVEKNITYDLRGKQPTVTLFNQSLQIIVQSIIHKIHYMYTYTVRATVNVKLPHHSSTSDTIIVLLQGEGCCPDPMTFKIKLSTCDVDGNVKNCKYEINFSAHTAEFKLGVKLGGDNEINEKESWLAGNIKLKANEPVKTNVTYDLTGKKPTVTLKPSIGY